MQSIYKKSKLIVTVGPASDNYETLKSLVLAGATCVRANFSHGTHEEQSKKFELAKQVAKDLNVPVSLMLDTKGPEIRIGKMKDDGVEIPANAVINLHTSSEDYESLVGNSTDISVQYDMSKDLKEGDLVLFDDGKLTSRVIYVEENFVQVKTENAHFLKTNKRINLPGVEFSLPFLSQKDIDDVLFGIKIGVNYVAASFVNTAQNIQELRKLLDENGGENIQIIAKIESVLGVKNIYQIIAACDGIMVARGDLGLEIPYYDVPYVQKQIIKKCRKVGKPVIVATQMLDSMENNLSPTRAEVNDVYGAIYAQADSTMLSGESASGKYPEKATEVMKRIQLRAEEEFLAEAKTETRDVKTNPIDFKDLAKLSYVDDNLKLIVVKSQTNANVFELSKQRPNAIISHLVNPETIAKYSNWAGEFGISYGVWTNQNAELYNQFAVSDEFVNLMRQQFELTADDKVALVDENGVINLK
ncbi:pyruvate kinase [Mycoplasmopsis columbinasalis]|uniref:Pyruvate kinase n=1 Tax=Mycoplasmopsis columbinasalis TaxID=114880 RepID=A0A449BAN2_9BACT|nr:pyruvate kinase [Mycoplasmopsis columbinasalis]VEU78230.1 pyruvate kinase [Mycoplasmopsis columbinasalis]